jgi:hypothetical protein
MRTHENAQNVTVRSANACLVRGRHPGDVVQFEPDEKHRRGAAQTIAMTHIALQEALDGKVVDLMTLKKLRKKLLTRLRGVLYSAGIP